jgi:hypothetical protein
VDVLPTYEEDVRILVTTHVHPRVPRPFQTNKDPDDNFWGYSNNEISILFRGKHPMKIKLWMKMFTWIGANPLKFRWTVGDSESEILLGIYIAVNDPAMDVDKFRAGRDAPYYDLFDVKWIFVANVQNSGSAEIMVPELYYLEPDVTHPAFVLLQSMDTEQCIFFDIQRVNYRRRGVARKIAGALIRKEFPLLPK